MAPQLWEPDALWPLPPNPYDNHTPPDTAATNAVALLVGLTLFPCRLVVLIVTVFLSWVVAKITSAGWPRGTGLRPDCPYPRNGWRRKVQEATIPYLVRANLFSLGFHRIVLNGKPAPRFVAPIWVCNHQGMPDIWFFLWRLLPVGVSAAENLRFPVINDIMASQQTIFVDREEGASGQKAAALLSAIARDARWPPLVVYPEGNTNNGRQLCAFKLGPFVPLLPVQPMFITYGRSNSVDVSWCEPMGKPIHALVLRMLLSPGLSMRATFLPPMKPEAGESAAGFAARVKAAMAASMGVAATEYSFSDTRLAFAARKLKIDPTTVLLEADKALRLWGVGYADARDALERFAAAGGPGATTLDAAGVAAALRLGEGEAGDAARARVLSACRQGDAASRGLSTDPGRITFREFVAGMAPLARAAPPSKEGQDGGGEKATFTERAAATLRAKYL